MSEYKHLKLNSEFVRHLKQKPSHVLAYNETTIDSWGANN